MISCSKRSYIFNYFPLLKPISLIRIRSYFIELTFVILFLYNILIYFYFQFIKHIFQ